MRQRTRLFIIVLAIAGLAISPLAASGQDPDEWPFGNAAFFTVWERTDLPVRDMGVSRTWIWGPHAISGVRQEPYEEAASGMRDVQYTDKSRMELPIGDVPPDSEWFITQGLLATELMTGQMQRGDDSFVSHDPSDAYVAGDQANNQSPTYAQMGELIDLEPRPQGGTITQGLSADGSIIDMPETAVQAVIDEYYVSETNNNIASVFWEFMNSTGPVIEDGQLQQDAQIFTNPFYAIGFPITEAYWGTVTVGTQPQNVLIQCFERRCLTYTPDNPTGWEVESGNIGQHYYDWRYNRPHYPDEDDDFFDDGVSDDAFSDDAVSDDGVSDDHDDSVERDWVYSLDPTGATSAVGETHTVTIHVRDQFDEPHVGVEVFGSVPFSGGATQAHVGLELDPYPAITDGDGKASMSYTGVEPGTDTVRVDIGDTGFSISTGHTWEDDSECVAPGQSIQDAIDAASPGDAICVEPGTFHEALSITTPGVTLTGQDGVVLDGDGVAALDSVGIVIDADDVTVEKFEIRNFLDANVEIAEASDTTLEHLSLLSPAETSIVIYESTGVAIADSVLSLGESFGVDRVGLSLMSVADFHIDNVTIEDADVGVRISADLMSNIVTGDGTLENSDISAPGGNAVVVNAGQNLTIRSNDISGDHHGIVLGNIFPQDILIENNDIADSRIGIAAGSATTSTISGNSIQGHEHHGVNVSVAAETNLVGNVISGSGSGIRIAEENIQATITGNEFIDNTMGIALAEAVDEPVTDNVFEGNNIGVQVSEDGAVDLSGNLFTGNNHGVLIVSNADASLSAVNFNDFVSNDTVGVVNHDSSNSLNATMNFWGDHTGPSDYGGTSATGEGDAVSQHVAYDPWHLTPLTD